MNLKKLLKKLQKLKFIKNAIFRFMFQNSYFKAKSDFKKTLTKTDSSTALRILYFDNMGAYGRCRAIHGVF